MKANLSNQNSWSQKKCVVGILYFILDFELNKCFILTVLIQVLESLSGNKFACIKCFTKI